MLDTGLGVQETAVNGRGHPPSRWEQTANKSTANHDSEGKERMMLRKGTGKEATPELTGGCSELPQKVLETPRSLRSFTVVSKSGPPTRLLLPWDYSAKNAGVVAMPSCRGSSQPRDGTHVSCLAGGLFATEPPREALGHLQDPTTGICDNQVRTVLTRVWVLTSAGSGRLLGLQTVSVLAWVNTYAERDGKIPPVAHFKVCALYYMNVIP